MIPVLLLNELLTIIPPVCVVSLFQLDAQLLILLAFFSPFRPITSFFLVLIFLFPAIPQVVVAFLLLAKVSRAPAFLSKVLLALVLISKSTKAASLL